MLYIFFYNDPATTEIYTYGHTLALPDALPIAEVAQTVINRYATAAMRHADCAALIIPSLPEYMRASEIVGRLDGVLLTGTPSNVEPARYGEIGRAHV